MGGRHAAVRRILFGTRASGDAPPPRPSPTKGEGETRPLTAAPFLEALHADKPLRVWSLIVTIFGDVVMRQGADLAPGPIWIAPLLDLLERLGVDPGLARTNLSRLVASGVLEREKAGRNTFYRLTPASAAEFARAARRIYRDPYPEPASAFDLAILDRAPDRAAARARLEAAGFRFASPHLALTPSRGEPNPEIPGAIWAKAQPEGEALALARSLWKIDALQAHYADFLARFSAYADAPLTPEAAIIARVAAVHRWRRVALRDPGLPPAALPADWAGPEARRGFERLLAAVSGPSETWLAATHFRSGRA